MTDSRRSTLYGFLLRPFWRDWVLGSMFIGWGFMFSGPHSPVPRWIALTMLPIGAVILVAAVVHAVWTVIIWTRQAARNRKR